MTQGPIQCCSEKPAFLVTYSVSDSEKDYLVCLSCNNLECFSKFILNKAPVGSFKNKNEKNNFSEEYDEYEELTEQQTEGDEVTAASAEGTEHPITFAEELS